MSAKVTQILVLTMVCLALLATTAPPGAAQAAAPAGGDGGVVFSFHGPDAKAVFLAGDFNNWNAQDLAMTRQDSGDWTISLDLAAGTYEYKFIVDGNWVEDPDNPERKSDPFGGSNSVVSVGSDGQVAAAATAGTVATAPTPATKADPGVTSGTLPDDLEVGAPRMTDGGILFTYRDSGAGSVYLAGSFNGWNAQDLPLTNDGQGNWALVHNLGTGEHEYKFVVDGDWLADPENTQTKTDPYGGSNSVVYVGDGGELLAAPAPVPEDDKREASQLNAKLYLGGRYLTRFEYAKNRAVEVGGESATDPRYRLWRPTQSVDLNFEAEISEMSSTYMRLRLDSNENVIQNNIAAFLNEANILIHPENFDLKVYWNQETYTGSDLLMLGGNIDLEGTIYHDHLDYGKGTAGALFQADPFGIKTELFFANVYNHDYYSNPLLFDNTGEDKFGARLSKKFGAFEVGVPLWMSRSLVWLDFGTEVGLPSTGIPSLDEYRANTGDTSTWYETESLNYNYGLDARANIASQFLLGAQYNYVDLQQNFVTGNQAGLENTNGRLDLPIVRRDRQMILGQLDFNPNPEMNFSVKYIGADMQGANPDQRLIEYTFLPMSVANKQIYFNISDSPASVESDSLDFSWDWHKENLDLTLWVRQVNRDLDFGAAGRTVPGDSTLTSQSEKVFKASLITRTGRPGNFWGAAELECAFTTADAGVAGLTADSFEAIFRYNRDLTRNFGLIADLRYIKYDYVGLDDDGAQYADDPGYFNPFAGFRYSPIKKLDLVLAYGVDPMDYSIDYQGRQLGRFWHRQLYLWENPNAGLLDAEQYLADVNTFTLRVQLIF